LGGITLLAQVRTIVAEHFDVDERQIKSKTAFAVDLGADSLDMAQLIMDLEEELDIEISDEDGAKFKTVQDVVNYLGSLV